MRTRLARLSFLLATLLAPAAALAAGEVTVPLDVYHALIARGGGGQGAEAVQNSGGFLARVLTSLRRMLGCA